MNTDEEIKKEFEEFKSLMLISGIKDKNLEEAIADWWISKLHTLQEEYKKDLIGAIENYVKGENFWDEQQKDKFFWKGALSARSKFRDWIINIIKQ